jgi:hypothetical protein
MQMSSIRASNRSIKDSEVRTGTGKGWTEWIRVLDEINAKAMPLTDNINYLVESHGIEQVWAQVIAVYYKWRV